MSLLTKRQSQPLKRCGTLSATFLRAPSWSPKFSNTMEHSLKQPLQTNLDSHLALFDMRSMNLMQLVSSTLKSHSLMPDNSSTRSQ